VERQREQSRSTGVVISTCVASLAVHATVAGLAWIAYQAYHDREARNAAAFQATPVGAPIAIELPAFAEGKYVADEGPDPVGAPPELHGGDAVAHMDTGKPGAGGERAVPEPALNLSDGDEHMRLSRDVVNRLDRDQLQRLDVSRLRASWEDRRATTHPMELTFVATGEGVVMERRPPALEDPSRGTAAAPSPGTAGADLGAPRQDEGDEDPRTKIGGDRSGALVSSPGVGVLAHEPGLDHRRSAAVASARPLVTQAPVSVPANDHARPLDDVDSEQEVATTVASLVHASTAGGLRGEGRGGTAGEGDPGAGGTSGAGSHARPLGSGDGDVFDINTDDPRLVPYFRQIWAKVQPLWANAFPKSAIMDLKEGLAILVFTVSSDGSVTVAWPPARASGIDEFDRNVANAIRRAAPFAPIPKELGRTTLRIRAPFHASNPIVR
jgi:TonB family protein